MRLMEFNVVAYGDGYLKMNGGNIDTTYFHARGWWADNTSDSSHTPAHIQLNAGTISTWEFSLATHLREKHGTMDIEADVLDIRRAGDGLMIQSHIDSGWLTGYGEASNDVIDTTSVEEYVLVSAILEPMTLSLLGLGGLALIRRRRA